MRRNSRIIYWYIPNFTPTCFSNSLPSPGGRSIWEATQTIYIYIIQIINVSTKYSIYIYIYVCVCVCVSVSVCVCRGKISKGSVLEIIIFGGNEVKIYHIVVEYTRDISKLITLTQLMPYTHSIINTNMVPRKTLCTCLKHLTREI
jgi:hypothetical protein